MTKLSKAAQKAILYLVTPATGEAVAAPAPSLAVITHDLPVAMAIAHVPARIEAGVPGIYRGNPGAFWWQEHHRELDIGLTGDVHRGSPGAPWWNEVNDGR